MKKTSPELKRRMREIRYMKSNEWRLKIKSDNPKLVQRIFGPYNWFKTNNEEGD